MNNGGAGSTRALILTPSGRDRTIAAAILNEATIPSLECGSLAELVAALNDGAGLGVLAEEALRDRDISALVKWLDDQPAWSDFPFVLLTQRGGNIERNPVAQRLSVALGNIGFLERPFHPTTLVSAARTALRGRQRQYEARERIEEIRRAELLLERRVVERTAELEAANRQLASQIVERERVEAVLRQTQRLEAIGQLTSGVAHDFNNLLTVVLGNVDQLRKTAKDPTDKRRLSMIADASQRGARLTAQMLAFSRRQRLEPRSLDLNDTVLSMRDMLQSAIGGSVQINPPQLADSLWLAMIDPTQIELVILNLAINARDAMAVGGALTIATCNVTMAEPSRADDLAAGDYVMLSVTDNGSGMTDEVLAQAFDPFFTTKEVGKGSGLGLSQVFGLAKQSGGGVAIDTEVGVGTTIKVYLPRAFANPAVPEDDRIEMSLALGAGRTVLLVDDDDAVREVTATYLRDLGYQVMEAGSGGAALDQLSAAIDALVLDFAMPGMNGAELEREVQSRRPGMPILFVTGYADAKVSIAVAENRVIQKPFTPSDLARKLALLLSRYAG